MNVADLIAKQQTLSPDLPAMAAAREEGVENARPVRVANVARHRRDWSFTPIDRYRELPDANTGSDPFKAVVIALDTSQPSGSNDAQRPR